MSAAVESAATVPVLVLLAFAGWTLLLLVATVGLYRWSRILTGRATIREWRAELPQGSARYQRAVRAHMNCVENLPVFTAVVVALLATGARGPAIDAAAVAYLAARIGQSVVHVALEQTERVAAARFALFFVQVVAAFAMGAMALPGR